MSKDDLNPARGIINGVLLSIPLWVLVWFMGAMAVAIYQHASKPEPEQVCKNYYGNEVPCESP